MKILPSLDAGARPWRARLRRILPETVAVVVITLFYFLLSARRHLLIETNSFDLGIFVQNVRGWAELTGPISAIKGVDFNLLGDHFSPILVLLAPLWWIWPSALVLLLAQALLLALGVAPLMAWARREWGLRGGVALAIVYALSFGLVSAVSFDFHEIAFAVPLVSLSVTFFGNARYRASLIAAAPLVLVKEDLGVTFIAVLGLLFLLRRQWKLGGIAIIGGFLATILAMSVIVPAFNSLGVYPYAGTIGAGDPFGLLGRLVGNHGLKIATIFTTLAISCFLALRSPIIVLALANLAVRFISERPTDWSTEFHYSATNMPIVFAAMIAGLIALSRGEGIASPIVRWALPSAIAVSIAMVLGGPSPLIPLKPSSWTSVVSPDSHVAAMREALELVPNGSVVAASTRPGAQLAERATVSVFSEFSVDGVNPEWIVVDTLYGWPEGLDARRDELEDAESQGYEIRFDRDDVVVLERR